MKNVPEQVIRIVEDAIFGPFVDHHTSILEAAKKRMEEAIKDYEKQKKYIEERDARIADIKQWLEEVKPNAQPSHKQPNTGS